MSTEPTITVGSVSWSPDFGIGNLSRSLPPLDLRIPQASQLPKHSGVFCCTKKSACTWQCYVLHQGLGWGNLEQPSVSEWKKYHDMHCLGKLVQLIPPNP
jgi:hypothetical protein